MTQRGAQSPLRGITYIVLALFLLTLADAATKWLGGSLPIWQIICLRALFILIPVAILTFRTGGLPTLRVHDYRGMAIRVFYYIGSTTLIATSMILLPLADAATLLFAGPPLRYGIGAINAGRADRLATMGGGPVWVRRCHYHVATDRRCSSAFGFGTRGRGPVLVTS